MAQPESIGVAPVREPARVACVSHALPVLCASCHPQELRDCASSSYELAFALPLHSEFPVACNIHI